MAYDRIEPFGERRADLRSGIVASTIAEVNRDRKKRNKPFSAAEFMPEFKPPGEEPEPQTWQQQLQLVELLNAAFGGKDLRKKPGQGAEET